MQQAGYLEPTFIKEEIREHQQQELSLLMGRHPETPTNSHLLNRKTHSLPSLVQYVTIESEEQRVARKRKIKGVKVMRYGRTIAVIVGVVILVDLLDDWFSSTPSDESAFVRIQGDYSSVHSMDDLTTDHVDTWCYDGHPKCKCKDPLQPGGRDNLTYWHRTHELNKNTVNTLASKEKGEVDVLFLGDSITEGWRGTSYGHTSARSQEVPNIFHKYFSKESGKYEGLPIGISGDTAPNLLWRLQNGELPERLNPNVVWLLIGTNDLGNAWCSPELVVIGIVRIVQELRLRKPAATIVINGLLPRTFHRKGSLMKGRSNFLSWNGVSLPSLWPDIIAINEELKRYAESHVKVHYFNTHAFFVDKDAPVEKLRIHGKLMPDHLHPSTEGYELWAKDIVQKLDELAQ